MITLGIETSCDETSCAVLEGLHEIRSNVVFSSILKHKPFGGVVPEIASRYCLEQIEVVFRQAIKKAGVKISDLDLIAVTRGPGLIGSLLVGVAFAKALAYRLKIPVIGVNHLEAHLSANFIGRKEPEQYIGLLVSGGHTSLSHHKKGKMKMLGSTVDDAVGEAFDKVAKMMGLGFPGGPVIDRLAKQGNAGAFRFTRPKQDNRYDFSFSGIKTAVLHLIQQELKAKGYPVNRGLADNPVVFDSRFIADMCASFQRACVSWLIEKTSEAARQLKTYAVVVGGGVSANSELRANLNRAAVDRQWELFIPPLALTNDNAAMIARRGAELYRQGHRSKMTLSPDPNLEPG